jgi:hypothetical protein
MKEFDTKIIKKWSPILDHHLKLNNTYLSYLCCHYFEYLVKKNSDDISIEIVNIKQKISEVVRFKVKIIDHYFNILTGKIEYKLENGKIVDLDNYIETIYIDDLVQIFGLDFLNDFDIKESREYKLNNFFYENNRE